VLYQISEAIEEASNSTIQDLLQSNIVNLSIILFGIVSFGGNIISTSLEERGKGLVDSFESSKITTVLSEKLFAQQAILVSARDFQNSLAFECYSAAGSLKKGSASLGLLKSFRSVKTVLESTLASVFNSYQSFSSMSRLDLVFTPSQHSGYMSSEDTKPHVDTTTQAAL